MKANAVGIEVAEQSPVLWLLGQQAASSKALPRVEHVERRGPVLHKSPLGESGEVLSLNLAAGCGHRCPFCFVRSYPTYPGDDVLRLYRKTAERLDEELSGRETKPWAVYVSPSTDPFPPLNDVQREATCVAATLTRHGVEAWFMTRGYVRPAALAALAQHRGSVRLTIGLTTLNRALQRVLEPLAAPPRLRLRQIAQMRKLGIKVQVALEPLVPGLTDTRGNFEEILAALAAVGVRHVSAGYLFLRNGIRERLEEALAPLGCDDVLDEFGKGPVLQLDHAAPARYLPKSLRQRGYSALMALAARFGITVSVSKLANPDFGQPRTAQAKPRLRQLTLPMF